MGCGTGAGKNFKLQRVQACLNFAGAGGVRTQNFNTRRTLNRYTLVLISALRNCATVWWPVSRFMLTGTCYTRHSQLFKKNFCNEEVAKVAKSSQIAK